MAPQWVPDKDQLPEPDTVATWVDGHIGHIQLAEPDRLNPLGANEIHIHYALHEFHASTEVDVVVISAQGRAFSAGADVRPTRSTSAKTGPDHDLQGWSRGQRLAYGYAYGNMWKTLLDFPKPLIAAVQGPCLGGGWELAHLCDIIVASDDAYFGAIEVTIGVPPYATAATYLARMIGKHRAMDWMVNGRRIGAQELLGLGLVNAVVPRDQLFDEAVRRAEEIAARPPLTVAAIKQLVHKAMDVEEFYELERALSYALQYTDDSQLARKAASEKDKSRQDWGRK
jgi:enoyl-CoA hydratase/carnithine racemase